MGERKSELLDAAIRYMAANGVANLSLRPLAAAIGSSSRLLIFHFKTKEKLLEEALTEVQTRFRTTLARVAERKRSPTDTPMKLFWQAVTDDKNLPLLRILYEAHFIAVQSPAQFGKYLERTSLDWIELIAQRLPPPINTKPIATLCAAVFDGLVIELIGTGDRRRTSKALDEFIGMLISRSKQ